MKSIDLNQDFYLEIKNIQTQVDFPVKILLGQVMPCHAALRLMLL